MPRFQMLTFFVKGFMLKLQLPGTLIAKGRFLGHYFCNMGPLGFAREIAMRGIKALWAAASVIALTAGVSLLPSEAAAQLNIPGAVFGAIHGGFPGGGSYGSSRRSHAHTSKHDSKDAKDDDEPSGHNTSERSSASNGKGGGEHELSAPVKSDSQPPSQPQPQTAASGPTPKSGGDEPSFSPSR
jgi:hypothetical protein